LAVHPHILTALFAFAVLCVGLALGLAWHDRRQARRARAQAQSALARAAAAEQRWRDVIETAGDWVWEMDADLRFTYVSERVRELTGIGPEAFLGKTRLEAIGGSLDDPVWRSHQADLGARRPFRDLEYEIASPSGERRVWRVSGNPVFDSEGRFRGYRGSTSDVTAEHHLRRAGSFLQSVLDNMGEGACVFDANLDLVTANRRLAELFGFDENEGIQPGENFEKLLRHTAAMGEYGDCDVEALVAERLAAARSREPYAFEHARPNGTVLEVRNNPLPDGGFVRVYTDITARKAAETKLRVSEQRFRDFASLGADWFWETDLDQRYTYHSGSTLLQGPGLFEGEIVGRRRPEILKGVGATPDPTPTVEAAMARGEPFHDLEYSFVKPDGEERWVRFKGVPVRDEAGGLVGYRGTGRDITARKLAEKALREKEQRYRSIFENAVEGMFQSRLDGTYIQVNPAVACMHGCASPEEFLQHFPSAELVYADDGFRERLIRAVREKGFTQGIQGEAYRMDGTTFVFRQTAWAVYDDTGRLVGFEGICEDITEAQRAERALRESEQRYRSISEMTTDMVYAYRVNPDRSLTREWVAGSLEGVDLDRHVGGDELCWTKVIHPEDAAQLESRLDRLLAGETPRQEFRIVDAAGRTRWIRLHSRAEFDHRTGQPVRIVGAASDITEIKESENALRAAKEAAEIANRAKTEFLANMSHELRTPLNAIIGFAEILEREVFGEIGARNRGYATDVRESGQIELSEERVVLDDVAESCFRLVRDKARRNGLSLDTRLPRPPVELWVDKLRLKQILLNLLSNAVKFTPGGGHVSLRGAHADDGGFLIQVVDTGEGLTAEQIARVMQPFNQADSAMSRAHEGTGLGLPLTRALTEYHGGRMWLDSEPGHGTTANIWLPRERVFVPAPVAARSDRIEAGAGVEAGLGVQGGGDFQEETVAPGRADEPEPQRQAGQTRDG